MSFIVPCQCLIMDIGVFQIRIAERYVKRIGIIHDVNQMDKIRSLRIKPVFIDELMTVKDRRSLPGFLSIEKSILAE